MALQFGTALRASMIEGVGAELAGGGKTLRIYSGAAPATPADAATGDLLASISLPSDPTVSDSLGSIAKSGTWEDTSADGSGTAGYFRIYTGTLCMMQGTVTVTGGGGDMEVTSTTFTAGQKFSVTTFTLTAANT